MPKYRTVIATSYDVEAKDRESAEETALELFEEEFGKPLLDVALMSFGVNTEKIEE